MWLDCIAFYLPRGQKLEDLVNADYYEMQIYIRGMEKFYEFEKEKIKAICGENKK